MPWFAVYKEADGVLVSTGSVLADPLPADLVSKEIPDRPTRDQRWDAGLKDFVAFVKADPDLTAFFRALVTHYGRANVATFLTRFPDFQEALRTEEYAAARAIIEAAATAGDLTANQRNAVIAGMDAHGLTVEA